MISSVIKHMGIGPANQDDPQYPCLMSTSQDMVVLFSVERVGMVVRAADIAVRANNVGTFSDKWQMNLFYPWKDGDSLLLTQLIPKQ